MDDFDTHMESKINKLKSLGRGTETLMQTMLGALKEESTQHEDNTTMKDYRMPLKKKEKVVECWQQTEVEIRMIVGKESVQKWKQHLEGNTTRAHARKRAQEERQLEGGAACAHERKT
jgi:hypothetical protein